MNGEEAGAAFVPSGSTSVGQGSKARCGVRTRCQAWPAQALGQATTMQTATKATVSATCVQPSQAR